MRTAILMIFLDYPKTGSFGNLLSIGFLLRLLDPDQIVQINFGSAFELFIVYPT